MNDPAGLGDNLPLLPSPAQNIWGGRSKTRGSKLIDELFAELRPPTKETPEISGLFRGTTVLIRACQGVCDWCILPVLVKRLIQMSASRPTRAVR